MKIAVVGTGISGMVCGHLLHKEHDLTFYESGDYIGGHTHTVPAELDGQQFMVDTGFIVFNDWTYPNFIKLLDNLGVASKPTSMSFSVKCDSADFEFSSAKLQSFFAQRTNLFRPKMYRMLSDIVKFGNAARAFLEDGDDQTTVGQFVDDGNYGEYFRQYYIVPMMSAIWSAPPKTVRDFPVRHFLHFFENHGLLNLKQRPRWRVVEGGSVSYVKKVTASYADRIRLNTPVKSVRRTASGVAIEADGQVDHYDEVVFACHSDQALSLLADATDQERDILGAIPYQKNDVVLHTDARLLPKHRGAWGSWNYNLISPDQDRSVLTYNMSMLQNLQTREPFCVTVNQSADIAPEKVLQRFVYHHPVYTAGGLAAQRRHNEISGHDHRTHYCGAYWGYGFHEDGVNSALAVCEAFGKRL